MSSSTVSLLGLKFQPITWGFSHSFPININGSHVAKSLCNTLRMYSLMFKLILMQMLSSAGNKRNIEAIYFFHLSAPVLQTPKLPSLLPRYHNISQDLLNLCVTPSWKPSFKTLGQWILIDIYYPLMCGGKLDRWQAVPSPMRMRFFISLSPPSPAVSHIKGGPTCCF